MEAVNSLLPAQRQQLIVDILKQDYTVRCSQLSTILEVSEMTIRRDLALLEHQGMIERTHGGAVFRNERVTSKFRYQNSKEKNFKEKKSITREAAKLIHPHDVIFIGEGTTASLLLNHVESNLPFTVFTNNQGIADEISNLTLSVELIMLGGVFNLSTCATAGNFTLEMIERINADKAFFGADGFNLQAGLTTANKDIAAIDRAMIRNTTGEIIIMSDHTKFGLVAAIEIAKPKEIDILVTDFKMSHNFSNGLKALNIEVIMT